MCRLIRQLHKDGQPESDGWFQETYRLELEAMWERLAGDPFPPSLSVRGKPRPEEGG